MKFSVSLYSFFSAIRNGELTPLACIAKAKEMGFDAIEAVDFVMGASSPEEMPEQAKKIKEEADKQGLAISSFAVGADLLNGMDGSGDTAKEIARVKSMVDIAAILGAPRMRHDITMGQKGSPRSYAALVPQLAESVREITEYAAGKGIVTMTENHGFFSQDSERVELLYNTVNHPNFGLLCDIGNFTCADENPATAVARVAPYTRYVHAKDFIIKNYYDNDPGEGAFQTRAGNYLRGTVIGHGNVPVKQCLHILKAVGYDDTIAIEFEGMEPALTAIRVGLANLKRYWEEA
ncbi:sugar phosphate isomerase/epimerase family protein [Acutalibacter caecimuris]|uniref:sugar phosphate isomerase/epimerase family protein n=1 Tax=Acutalibacter caecimuris TaxID=3093657 RepID=UPI002AC90A41|nr:sugar phosphate isomerase/epimerase family protein [Acutalibacter sp. M00118]